MRIVLLGEFTDLNKYINAERRNRFLGAKIKKDNTNNALKQLTLKEVVEVYPVGIIFTWYTRNIKVDPDNTAFAKKFILDALVTKGILKSDGRKFICELRDLYKVDKDNPRVEIALIEGNSLSTLT